MIVADGELGFTSRFALEWSVLGRGAAGAREHIRELLETVTDEGLRQCLMEMNQTPALVPTDRDEINGRAYGLIREAGEGVRDELLKIGYPPDEMDILDTAFLQGFCDAGLGRNEDRDGYIGAARWCYSCGCLVANVIASIFPDDENEPTPDCDEVVEAFRRGLIEQKEEVL